MQSGARLGFFLLLTPLVLWLSLLIVIPHIDMFLVSMRERVGVRQYETSFANYLTFFTEPLYIWTFVRTAVMSVLATIITLLIAFPVSLFIAKIARGRTATGAVRALPDPVLRLGAGAHLRLDDPAA